jgi:hypothetical protein
LVGMAVCGVLLVPGFAAADNQGNRASGKGLVLYSDNTTTPQRRPMSFGDAALGSKAATLASRACYLVVRPTAIAKQRSMSAMT